MRVAHGKAPIMNDNVICEDMAGVHEWFNNPVIQVSLHVEPQKFEACSDEVA